MNSSNTPIRKWVSGRLSPEVELALNRLARTADVHYIAIMPDVHLAADVCIGTVLATKTMIYPAAVGGDIGCGISAIRIDAMSDRFASARDAAELLSALYASVPQNRHGQTCPDASVGSRLPNQPLSNPLLAKLKSREGRVQLGTLGRGNHFLEFQANHEGRLWLMIHSGSRAMGQAITRYHLHVARRSGASPTSPTGRLVGLDSNQEVGQAYLADMNWACSYAQENRMAMLDATLEVLQRRFGIDADRTSIIDTNHNHVRRERHFGESFWVHRKGAQQLDKNQRGLVPGSMGTSSFVVAGRGEATSLSSCAHGAGRQLSRTEARRRITSKRLCDSMGAVWFDQRKQHQLREEAPLAYKDIYQVMRDQPALIRVVAEHRPVLSFKGH